MKVEQLVPEVYYKDSRDFAFIGRCFELIFNYMKSGAECVNVNYLTDAIDSTIIELMADTVGFTAKHKYDSKNLLAVAGSFQNLLRNKGSLYSVELAVMILMNAQKIYDKSRVGSICEIDPNDPFNLIIKVSDRLSDTVLLEDIFDYILPAGMTYVIVRDAEGPGMLESEIVGDNAVKRHEVESNTDIIAPLIIESDEISNHIESRGLNIAQVARGPYNKSKDLNNKDEVL